MQKREYLICNALRYFLHQVPEALHKLLRRFRWFLLLPLPSHQIFLLILLLLKERISTAPAAVCLEGNVYRYVGSQMDNLGYNRGWLISSFSWVFSLLMTAPEFISEPVAHIVRTTATGSAPATRLLSLTRSQGWPS